MSLPPSSAATLVSIATGVENDLRTLVAEGKRKVADLQPSAERAIQRLRQIAQQAPAASPPSTPKAAASAQPAESAAETLQSDLILRPLLLVTSAKQPKLTLVALGSVQKLLSLVPLTPRFIATVIGTLRIQAEVEDGAVQLRILQTLLLCIAPASIACGEILTGSLLQSLGICFRLFASRSPVIHNTSSAALRQIVSLLYDKVQQDSEAQGEDEQRERREALRSLAAGGNEEMKSSCTSVVVTPDDQPGCPVDAMSAEQQNGFLLFRDLCILSNASDHGRTQPRWLTLSSPVPPSLCIELIEAVLSSSRPLFHTEPAFFVLLKRDACVLLSRLLRSNFDFPVVVRVVRCVALIVRHFHSRLTAECEVFLTLLIKMLGAEFPLWQQVLVLECWTLFSSSSSLLYFFFLRYDDSSNNKVVASVCHALGSFISSSQVGGEQAGLLGWKLSGGRKPVRAMDALNEEDSPQYDDVSRVSLSIESIIHIVNGLTNLAALSGATTEQAAANGSGQAADDKDRGGRGGAAAAPEPGVDEGAAEDLRPDSEVLKRLVLSCWTPILASLSSLLAKTSEEAQVQHLLMAYQSFTNTCGMLQLVKPRDALLQSLCSFALKKQLPRDDSIAELMREVLTPGSDGQLQPLLTAKNIQALKALFNIAHCLGSYLGSAWSIVLETFHQLDTVIQLSAEVQSRMLRDSSALQEQYRTILPNAAEIVIMNTALSRLFESTRFLDDAAVTQVLSALGALSLTTLAAAGDAPSSLPTSPSGGRAGDPAALGIASMRVFSLANLIATIEHNMFRISSARLWQLGISHLTCVITHRDARMRAYGVEALRKLTCLALGKRPPGPSGGSSRAGAGPSAGGGSEASSSPASPASSLSLYDDPEQFQLSLLSPLTELYVKSRYEDTRLQLLQALHSILQAAGQQMTAGWSAILDWLGLVCEIGGAPASPREGERATGAPPQDKERERERDKDRERAASQPQQAQAAAVPGAALISLGFNSLQLIVNDFIDSVPLSCLQLLIACIGQYCLQRLDTNISFTSIGLLWRVSDYIARIVGVRVSRRRSSVLPDAALLQPPHGMNGSQQQQEADVLTEPAADRLMLSLFSQLHCLSVDQRSEVRNSAVKTFSSTLVAHCGRMRADSCMECLQAYQLPLLQELLTPNAEREKDSVGVGSTELGKDKDSGKSVMMMVHHSRDTAAKQWDETRVFALQGAARVLRVYIESWSALQAFTERWPLFLSVCVLATQQRSTEVGLAAVNALQDVLAAPSSQAAISEQPQLWQPVMPAYTQIVQHAVEQAQQLLAASSAAPLPAAALQSQPQSLASLGAEAGWKHWMKLYTQLVVSWQLLVASSAASGTRLFSDQDVSALLELSAQLTAVDVPAPRRRGLVESETAIQSASLRLIETLTPVPLHQWPMLIRHLLGYVLPASELQLSAVSPFTRRALKVLDGLYSAGSSEAQAAQFPQLVTGLCGFVRQCESWLQSGGDSCEEVVASFSHIVETGLPAAAEAGQATAGVWSALLSAFAAFLAAPSSPLLPPLSLPPVPTLLPPRSSAQEQQQWEHLQIAMVGLLVRCVLPCAAACPLDTQWQLVTLLNVGYNYNVAQQQQQRPPQPQSQPAAPTAPMPNELLTHACMMGLFALVALAVQPESGHTCYVRLGLLSLPLLLHRCQHILACYVADQQLRGQQPQQPAAQQPQPQPQLPQCRREEAGFVLRELLSLSVHPQLTALLRQDSQLDYVTATTRLSPSAQADEGGGWRGHLLALYPALCDCVCCDELELRELLRDLLHAAGSELGLERQSRQQMRKQSAAVQEAVKEIVASSR